MSKKTQLKARFVDIPELSETFADSIHTFSFDGQSMNIEFCVTRLDEIKPPKLPTTRRYPSCRLVLTPDVTLDLFNKLQGLVKVLEKNGVVEKKAEQIITPETMH